MLCVTIRGKEPNSTPIMSGCNSGLSFLLLEMELKTAPIWWAGVREAEGLVPGRSSDYVSFMLFEICD